MILFSSPIFLCLESILSHLRRSTFVRVYLQRKQHAIQPRQQFIKIETLFIINRSYLKGTCIHMNTKRGFNSRMSRKRVLIRLAIFAPTIGQTLTHLHVHTFNSENQFTKNPSAKNVTGRYLSLYFKGTYEHQAVSFVMWALHT